MMKHGTPNEVVILRELEGKLHRATGEAAKRSLERKINAHVRSIESRGAHTNKKSSSQDKTASLVMKHGTPKEVMALREMKGKLRRATGEAAKRSLEHKINALVRSVESRGAHTKKSSSQDKTVSLVMKHGTPKEVVIFRELKGKLRRATGEAAKRSLERKINALVRSVESRGAHTKKKSFSGAAVSFM